MSDVLGVSETTDRCVPTNVFHAADRISWFLQDEAKIKERLIFSWIDDNSSPLSCKL